MTTLRRPSIDGARTQLATVQMPGYREAAFGWQYLAEARLWKVKNCTQVAAE